MDSEADSRNPSPFASEDEQPPPPRLGVNPHKFVQRTPRIDEDPEEVPDVPAARASLPAPSKDTPSVNSERIYNASETSGADQIETGPHKENTKHVFSDRKSVAGVHSVMNEPAWTLSRSTKEAMANRAGKRLITKEIAPAREALNTPPPAADDFQMPLSTSNIREKQPSEFASARRRSRSRSRTRAQSFASAQEDHYVQSPSNAGRATGLGTHGGPSMRAENATQLVTEDPQIRMDEEQMRTLMAQIVKQNSTQTNRENGPAASTGKFPYAVSKALKKVAQQENKDPLGYFQAYMQQPQVKIIIPKTALHLLQMNLVAPFVLWCCMGVLMLANCAQYFNPIAISALLVIVMLGTYQMRDFFEKLHPACEEFEKSLVHRPTKPLEFRLKYMYRAIATMLNFFRSLMFHLPLICLCWYWPLIYMVLDNSWTHFQQLSDGEKAIFFLYGFFGLFLMTSIFFFVYQGTEWVKREIRDLITHVPGCEHILMEDLERDLVTLPNITPKPNATPRVMDPNSVVLHVSDGAAAGVEYLKPKPQSSLSDSSNSDDE